MSGAIDFDAINAVALRSGRSLVQDLIPGGKFRSLEYVVRNPCRNDNQAGSFSINYRSWVSGRILRPAMAVQTLFRLSPTCEA